MQTGACQCKQVNAMQEGPLVAWGRWETMSKGPTFASAGFNVRLPLNIMPVSCMMVLYGIVPWFECQLIIQYPERGLLPSNLVTGQGSYHLLSPYWPPVPNQVDGLTLLDQAGQAALQFCQPEDALSFIANATAGTFNQRGMCAHIYYSCLKSAALECKLSIILKV